MKSRSRIILDRCNPSARDRQYFAALSPTPRAVVVVWLDLPLTVCQARVAARVDHPTIPSTTPRAKSDRIVASFHRSMEALDRKVSAGINARID